MNLKLGRFPCHCHTHTLIIFFLAIIYNYPSPENTLSRTRYFDIFSCFFYRYFFLLSDRISRPACVRSARTEPSLMCRGNFLRKPSTPSSWREDTWSSGHALPVPRFTVTPFRPLGELSVRAHLRSVARVKASDLRDGRSCRARVSDSRPSATRRARYY